MTARQARRAVLVISLLAAPACQSPAKDALPALIAGSTAVARETRLERALRDETGARDDGAPIAQWFLPKGLQEISGLALSSDGKLFTHDDELGRIWEIDYRRGVLMKRFSLGKGVLRGDFEGLAVANELMFLLASNGTLYEFREGADDAHVEYQVHDTGLMKECEFEGVAFDPAINSLVLACKHVYTKSLKDDLVIYRWSLASDTAARLSRLAVPLAGIIGANSWKGLHPSDITIDPLTGNYVLVAAQEKALISITPAGALVFSRPLPAAHHQAEGVAITKDSILIVSDEAGQRPAMITLYKWPE
jgi:uncharacterized protein YjiK